MKTIFKFFVVCFVCLTCINNIGYSQLQSDTSDAVWSIVMPIAKSDNIDLKKCLVGTYKDSVVNEFIINIGSYPFRVDSIYFEGNDASAFGIVSGLPQYIVDVGSYKHAEFRFTPNREGIHSAYVVTITQADTIKYKIKGEGVLPQLSVLNNVINFGVVDLGNYKDTLKAVTIKNVGSAPLIIKETKHGKPNDKDFTTIAGGGSFTLAPGDTCKMDLRFTPTFVGRTNGTLEFYYDGTGSPAVVQLYGESWTCIDNVQASIPAKSQELSFDSVNILDLKCQSILLKNLSDEEIIFDSIFLLKNYEFSIPQSQLPITIASYDSALLKVCFSPIILGLRTDTILIYNNCGTKRIPLNGICKPNNYTGESRCDVNVELTTEKLSRIIVLPPSPNPFYERTSIIYSISKSGTVAFDFYNVYGEKIAMISQIHNNSGTYQLEYKPDSKLQSGLYYCIVRMDDQFLLFKLLYMK